MKRVVVLALILQLVTPPASTGAPVRGIRVSLASGEGHVWRGPYLDRAAAGDCAASGACSTYEIDVESAGAWRLRVGIDHPDHHDRFSFSVISPAGEVVATRNHRFLETPEAIVLSPQKGVWRVEVRPVDVTESGFTMRAALDARPDPQPRGRLLLPNLRAEPGFDFTFTTPVGSNLGVVGPTSTSCHADETAEDHAARCLRFSFGYQNAGSGPMELRFSPMNDQVGATTSVTQIIYRGDATPLDYSDNPHIDQPAGTATYHRTHAHFHYDGVFTAYLYRVEDMRTGRVVQIGDVAKRGACAHDWVMVDFERFFQDPQGTADSGSDCNFGFTDPTSQRMRIGLSKGWSDIYPLELSDNYVDFTLGEDEMYLLRFFADEDNWLRELNEKDNTAYALIEIAGDEVSLVERGRGDDPWDPDKRVLVGLGE